MLRESIYVVVLVLVELPLLSWGAAGMPRKPHPGAHTRLGDSVDESDGHFIYHEEPSAIFTYEALRQNPFFSGSFLGGVTGLSSYGPPFPEKPDHAPVRPHSLLLQGPPPTPPLRGAPQTLQASPQTHISNKQPHVYSTEGGGGCDTKEGFYFAGQTWYTQGCRRRTCIHFRGSFIIETDSCDSEIFNTTYKCIVQVDINAHFPDCCPKYHCNPDNLGNSVK
ncbi:uncharacterized protein [Procambarus clarkii]|uniref:uncharacterized protein n=1 Tax=Procambarus clarkii TaxID=6728 RepID=UPI001E6784B3|nr:uncharacterized protein LOC123770214 [Procambarus clarkii]